MIQFRDTVLPLTRSRNSSSLLMKLPLLTISSELNLSLVVRQTGLRFAIQEASIARGGQWRQ